MYINRYVASVRGRMMPVINVSINSILFLLQDDKECNTAKEKAAHSLINVSKVRKGSWESYQ